jgi:hypothetical protein
VQRIALEIKTTRRRYGEKGDAVRKDNER